MIFTKDKEGDRAIRAQYKMQKICGWKIYSRPRTFNAEVHKSIIRVKRWHNKYQIVNWKETTFASINDLLTKSNRTALSRGTNVWDTLATFTQDRYDVNQAKTFIGQLCQKPLSSLIVVG